jgi:hypothetical protein
MKNRTSDTDLVPARIDKATVTPVLLDTDGRYVVLRRTINPDATPIAPGVLFTLVAVIVCATLGLISMTTISALLIAVLAAGGGAHRLGRRPKYTRTDSPIIDLLVAVPPRSARTIGRHGRGRRTWRFRRHVASPGTPS